MDPRHALGDYGETQAEVWLNARGLKIIERQYQTRFGEIDLIARDGDTWVFIEVKTRTTRHAQSALDAITPAKQRRLGRAAYAYILRRRLWGCSFRFDVVTLEAGELQWLPNAFDVAERWTL